MEVCGKWFDIWANKSTGQIHYSKGDMSFSDNQIQNAFSTIMAQQLISIYDAPSVLYLAFGHGDTAWDYFSYDQSYEQTTLVDEFYRVPIFREVRYTGQTSTHTESLFYYVDSDYEESETATTAIEAKIYIPEGIADGIYREFAMFGEDATEVVDSGTIVNWVVHPMFDKTGYELTRTIRLIFRQR